MKSLKRSKKEKREYVLLLMQHFFADKSFYCGGPIPNLFCEKNINLVSEMDFLKACDLIHKDLSEYYYCDEKEIVSWRTKLFLEAIASNGMRAIPRDHKGGIFILYIKYCKGFLKLWMT